MASPNHPYELALSAHLCQKGREATMTYRSPSFWRSEPSSATTSGALTSVRLDGLRTYSATPLKPRIAPRQRFTSALRAQHHADPGVRRHHLLGALVDDTAGGVLESKKERSRSQLRARVTDTRGNSSKGCSELSLPRNSAKKLSHRALLKRAAEDVPRNSGHQTFGAGPYRYVKMAMDGSMRVFRFRSHLEAMEAGIHGTLPNNCN